MLSFAGTTDRIAVTYAALGVQLAPGDLTDLWTQIETAPLVRAGRGTWQRR